MDDASRAIETLLRARWGLVFPPQRSHALDDGIRRAVRALELDDASLLATRLAEGDERALAALAAATTVGETYFFRDRAAFERIRVDVLPAAGQRRGRSPVRIWSAGCATGEEAYSLAIVAREVLGPGRYEVLGTDLSEEHVARARRGVYRPWSFRDVDPAVVDRWFQPVEGGAHAVDDELRAQVRFEVGNLLEPGPRDLDLILCRNVLIYFDPDGVARALHHLAASLAPDGRLLLGPVDPSPPPEAELERLPGALQLHVRRRGAPPAPPAAIEAPRPAPMPPLRARRPLRPQVRAAPALAPRVASAEASAPPADAATATLARARRHGDAGDDREALALVGRAIAGSPDDPEGYLLRATLLQAVGRDADAVVDLQRALFLDPTLALAHALLGASLLRLGEPQRAERALAMARASVARSTDDPEVRDAIGGLGRTLARARGGTR